MMYFHFFLFGNIVRRYWDRAQRLMDSGWFLPVVLAVAFFCVMDTLKWHTLRLQWANLPRTASMYLLLTLVIMYFRHYGEAFTGRTRLGRGLQYIGVRTLDIYLIHYLFIPHVGAVGAFFNSHRGNFCFRYACLRGCGAARNRFLPCYVQSAAHQSVVAAPSFRS